MKALLLNREAERDALNKQVAAQKAAVQETEAAKAKATAEVASLAAQYASERIAPASAAPSAAHGDIQVPPGFVSVAFAEERWAEREAAFAQQLEQLRALQRCSAQDR